MKTVEITAYTFAELLERAANGKRAERRAAEAAHVWLLEQATGWGDWYEPEVEYWKEKLEEEGFTDVDIRFSGFWSQGDGASFTTDSIDLEKFIRKHYEGREQARMLLVVEVAEAYARIERFGHRYVHENTVRVSLNHYAFTSERVSKKLEDLEEKLEEVSRERMQEIYAALRKEYEYQTSEEALTDMAEANEWRFDALGRFIPEAILAAA